MKEKVSTTAYEIFHFTEQRHYAIRKKIERRNFKIIVKTVKNIKMGTEGGKRLSELRVCDLKVELEKRSLETTGVKMDLVKRLQEVSVKSIFFSYILLLDGFNILTSTILYLYCKYDVA